MILQPSSALQPLDFCLGVLVAKVQLDPADFVEKFVVLRFPVQQSLVLKVINLIRFRCCQPVLVTFDFQNEAIDQCGEILLPILSLMNFLVHAFIVIDWSCLSPFWRIKKV